MSESIVGLGVRNPVERGEQLARRFSRLVETLHVFGNEVALIGNALPYGEAGSPDQQVIIDSVEEPYIGSVQDEHRHIAAIRDFTGRMTGLECPVINEQEVRMAASDKWQSAKLLHGLVIPTTLIPKGVTVSESVSELDQARYVVKPRFGMASSGIELFDSIPGLGEETFGQDMVLQPFVDSSHFPDVIRPQGEYNANLLRRTGVPKELRIYVFRHTDGTTDLASIARVSGQPDVMGEDSFVIIDQDTVPDEAHALAINATRIVSEATEVDHIFASVDLAFEPVTGEPLIREMNVKEPAIPGKRQVREGEDSVSFSARVSLSNQVYDLMAKQLAQLVA